MTSKVYLFSKIPLDILCEIADFSDLETTFTLSKVNKQFNEAIETHNSSMVWREKEKQYGYFKEEEEEEDPKANAVIGFKITNIKTLPYEKKLQKIFGVIKLFDYFNLNNFTETTKMIVRDIFSCDTQTQNSAFIKIATEYIKIGRLKKASKIAKNITDGHKSLVLTSIAKKYIKIEKLNKAKKIAEKIPYYFNKLDVITSIAKKYGEERNFKKIEKLKSILKK